MFIEQSGNAFLEKDIAVLHIVWPDNHMGGLRNSVAEFYGLQVGGIRRCGVSIHSEPETTTAVKISVQT